MEEDLEYRGPERRARVRTTRFVTKYELRRAERLRGEHHPLVRPFRIGAAIVLLIGAALVGWLPGPGGLFFFLPGALLLGSEIQKAAVVMDRIENETLPRLSRLRDRLRRSRPATEASDTSASPEPDQGELPPH